MISGTRRSVSSSRQHRQLDRQPRTHVQRTSGCAATPAARTASRSAATARRTTPSSAPTQGNTIAVAVTGNNTGGNATADAASVDRRHPGPRARRRSTQTLPAISGTTTVGQQLTALPAAGPATRHPRSCTSGCAATPAARTARRSDPDRRRPTPSSAPTGQHDRRRRHRHQHERQRHRHLTTDRGHPGRERGSRQHRLAVDHRHNDGRSAAHRRCRQLDRQPGTRRSRYQWLRCDAGGANCTPIGSPTASTTYTLVGADQGNTIAVAVTGTNTSGNATATSQPTAVIQAASAAPANTGLPSITGTTTVGQQLTAAAGSWTGNPAPTFVYQWLRCDAGGANCNPIGTATASTTYTLVGADQGNTIAVAVTGTNTSGNATATSQPTAVIQAATAAPVNTGLPTITGTTTVGQQLDRRCRQLDRQPGTHVHVSVAALRRRRRELQPDRIGDRLDDLHPRRRRPGQHHRGRSHRHQQLRQRHRHLERDRRRAGGNAATIEHLTADDQRHDDDRPALTASPGSWTGNPAPDVHVSVAALRHRRRQLQPDHRRRLVDLHPRRRPTSRQHDHGRSHRHQHAPAPPPPPRNRPRSSRASRSPRRHRSWTTSTARTVAAGVELVADPARRGFAAMKITGNAAQDAVTTAAFAWNYWNPATFGPELRGVRNGPDLRRRSDVIRIGARVTGRHHCLLGLLRVRQRHRRLDDHPHRQRRRPRHARHRADPATRLRRQDRDPDHRLGRHRSPLHHEWQAGSRC